MLKNILTVGIAVSNSEEALDFYINKLGFEKRRDVSAIPPPGCRDDADLLFHRLVLRDQIAPQGRGLP